jgi:dethiobiotin synthetase
VTAEVVLVSGTGTGVGKTWVAAELLRRLRKEGVRVSARKPVQSFDPDEGSTDADLLAQASGEPAATVCPGHRSYPIPMAPPIAAEVLGQPAFTLAELVGELRLPESVVTIVEAIGGPRSPLASDGDSVALADAIDASLVVLVAEPVLGGINATILAAGAFGSRPLVVYLNRFRPDQLLHRTNLEWLTKRAGLRVVTDLESLTSEVADLAARSAEVAGSPA